MKNSKKIISFLPFLMVGVFFISIFLAHPVLADGWDVSALTVYGLPDASIYTILSEFLYWILAIFGILGVIGFAISGVMYLISAGNDTMTGNAKKAMTASIIGVVIGLSGLVIIQAVDWALAGFSF